MKDEVKKMTVWKLLAIVFITLLFLFVFVLIWPGGVLTCYGWAWGCDNPVVVSAPFVKSVLTSDYPLAGEIYFSNRNPAGNNDPEEDPYHAVWTESGWLWQPNLPSSMLRKWHAVAITLEEGNYVFNGVSCRFYLDTNRNGKGSLNPLTASYGNGLPFTVNTKDGGQAWGLVECDGTDVTGFSIQWMP